jgi:hypothetical protein
MSASESGNRPFFAARLRRARKPARTAQPASGSGDPAWHPAEAAELPLARASTLPAAAYTSEEFFDWEVAHLLRKGWQCVAHVSQIPSPATSSTSTCSGSR